MTTIMFASKFFKSSNFFDDACRITLAFVRSLHSSSALLRSASASSSNCCASISQRTFLDFNLSISSSIKEKRSAVLYFSLNGNVFAFVLFNNIIPTPSLYDFCGQVPRAARRHLPPRRHWPLQIFIDAYKRSMLVLTWWYKLMWCWAAQNPYYKP